MLKLLRVCFKLKYDAYNNYRLIQTTTKGSKFQYQPNNTHNNTNNIRIPKQTQILPQQSKVKQKIRTRDTNVKSNHLSVASSKTNINESNNKWLNNTMDDNSTSDITIGDDYSNRP